MNDQHISIKSEPRGNPQGKKGVFRTLRPFIHRMWQKLPQAQRRRLLNRVTASFAPRPTGNPLPKEPVIVAGALRAHSGLGESARLCIQALAARGEKIFAVDLGPFLFQNGDVPNHATDGSKLYGPGVVIFHVSGPLIPLSCLILGKRFISQKHIIAYWAWELTKLPDDWHIAEPYIHEVWVPSRFTAGAVASQTSHRVKIVPHAIRPINPAAEGERAWRRRSCFNFSVLTMFDMASSFTRKNPLAAISAFQRAFGQDMRCHLVIKIANVDAYPSGRKKLFDAIKGVSNIHMLDSPLTRSQITALYDECDVVISLHRSEGFGLILAEAMIRGRPVVATAWSGNMDYMHALNSCPVAYRLVPAIDPQFTYHFPDDVWAEPDIDHAARCLQTLRQYPDLARRIGLKAAEDASAYFSIERYPDPIKKENMHFRC